MYQIYPINSNYLPVKNSVSIDYFVHDNKGINCLGANFLAAAIYYSKIDDLIPLDKYSETKAQPEWLELQEKLFLEINDLPNNPNIRYQKYITPLDNIKIRHFQKHTDKITDLQYYLENGIAPVLEVNYSKLWGVPRNSPSWHSITLVGIDLMSQTQTASILDPSQTKFRFHTLPIQDIIDSWNYKNRYHIVVPKHVLEMNEVEELPTPSIQTSLDTFFERKPK